jgi:hypothetical protein
MPNPEPLTEDAARQFVEQIKKTCLSQGIWVKCEEVIKEKLDFINMTLTIKVGK